MTAVADIIVPGPRLRTVAPAFPEPDLTVSDLVAEMDTESADQPCSEAEWIDRIAQLESLQHRLASVQSAAMYAFARQHAATRAASGAVEPEKLERSISAQIALACRVSRTEGRKRLHMARDLRGGHDHVRDLFAAGQISSYKTSTITTATGHLDAAERAEVDRRLAGHDLARLGVGRIRDLARRLAAEVAPEKFTARNRAARTGRRVTPCVPPPTA